MISKKQNLKIATILPYKENYSTDNASAASLWVSEFYKRSKFKKNNYIFGNTSDKKYLTNNYININLLNLNSKFKSSTTEYCKKLVKIINNENFDLIEIHNRPLILKNLVSKINSKFLFYFHNDPLSMKGSKTINERLFILKSVSKIIFVSEWTRDQFFTDLDFKLKTKAEVVYPSVNKQKLTKKFKYITFVGKLNTSKGYDIFKDAILKILDEYKDWKAFSAGNEDRRKIYINHDRHIELGFIKHKKILELLNKSEIAVVPSRWEEPFGRTALEASSRACVTVISNRGGLTETTSSAIILKKLDHQNLYNELKKIIKSPLKRKKIQKVSYENIKHLIPGNTKIIDEIRESCVPKFNINILFNKLKIINLYNQGQKINHRLINISLGKKFTNGFIRNNHDVLEISDRDFIKSNRSLSFQSTKKIFQNYLIETFKNYSPDILFFGHTKNIEIETLKEMKSLNSNLIISHWNEDPIMKSLDYSKKNLNNIGLYSNIADHNFITTHPSVLKNKVDNFHYFFIPVDRNIERFNVFKLNPKKDIFYAMSHGVNRATLKSGVEDDRIYFLDKLINKLDNIKYDFYGFSNKQPIWGSEFSNALVNSKMGLNLSRGKPTKYYSSNRIASIMGNGLLTFIDQKVCMNHFFNKKEIVFYSNINDLADKIKFYAKNDKLRKKIASNGKKKYFKLFNETNITKYILDVSTGKDTNLFK